MHVCKQKGNRVHHQALLKLGTVRIWVQSTEANQERDQNLFSAEESALTRVHSRVQPLFFGNKGSEEEEGASQALT